MPISALSDPLRDQPIGSDNKESWERRLCLRVAEMVARADVNEDARRRTDRIGANLIYGRHWQVAMPAHRAALTVNFAKALTLHKIAIMTKQDPIPVIEATQFGDAEASELLKQVVMKWWRDQNMKLKLRRVQLLACSTRTAAFKICWDNTLNGGVGDVAVDTVPGWRLILDDSADDPERMGFIGHRETLRRSEALLMYPNAAERIYRNAGDYKRGQASSTGGMPTTPLGDPWRRMAANGRNLSTIVNGKPVISAYTLQDANSRPHSNTVDQVQIVELFHRDRSMHEVTEKAYDAHGNPRKIVLREDNGMPKFNEVGEELHQSEDGSYVSLPKFELQFEHKYEKRLKPKYPHWRRTTVILPDLIMVDDRAWDGPVPYALYSDGDALEGPWVKGGSLDLEDCQVVLNVSLSSMMDNLRMAAYRPVLAGQSSNIEGNTLLVRPGQIIRVGDVAQIKPMEFPQLAGEWFQWCEFIVKNMERLIGATGVMQGEAAGRVDSAAGYDLLAEIGGSRLVECTQRMEQSIVQTVRIVSWFMQNKYSDKHAHSVMDAEGNISEESLGGAFLRGSFNYNVVTGSTMAWSESAVKGRLMQELQAGIIDLVAYWQRSNTPDWQQIMKRKLQTPPQLQPTPPKKAQGPHAKPPMPAK